MSLLAQWKCNDIYDLGGVKYSTDSVGANAYPLKLVSVSALPTLETGKVGQALQTAGAGYMRANGTIPLASKTAFSMAMWAYIGTPDGVIKTAFNFQQDRYVFMSYLGINAGKPHYILETSAGQENRNVGSYVQNAWNHFVLRWNGGTVQLYRDLLLQDDRNLGGSYTNNPSYQCVGCLSYDNGFYYYWPWKLDEIYVYDHFISDEEMTALYNKKGLIPGIPAGIF